MGEPAGSGSGLLLCVRSSSRMEIPAVYSWYQLVSQSVLYRAWKSQEGYFFSYVQFFCDYFTDEVYREMGPDEKLTAGKSL